MTKEENNSLKRIMFIDNLRLLAAISVIILHCASMTYNFYCPDKTSYQAVIVNFLWVVTRYSVPVFIMITGYLLLQPSKDIDYRKVFTKYIWKIVCVLFTIGLFYSWLEIVFKQKTISINQIFESVGNVITGNLWDLMWYLYMLIGLYLIMPPLKRFINNTTNRELDVFIGILVLFCVILPFLKQWLGVSIGVVFPIVGIGLLYFLLGYRLCDIKATNKFLIPLSLGIISFIAVCLYIKRDDASFTEGAFIYSSPSILLLSVCIFLLFRNAGDKFNNKCYSVSSRFAKYTFGVYLFHPLYLNIIDKVFHWNPIECGGGVSFILVIIVVFFLSVASTWLFQKIPFIGKCLQ